MVADGVDGVVDNRTFVVLLGFFELFGSRFTGLVDQVKNLHRVRVCFIPGLRRINVNSTTDEEDFVLSLIHI